jgi:hypothetical protein
MKRRCLLAFVCSFMALTSIAQDSAYLKDSGRVIRDMRSLPDKEKDQVAKTLQPSDGKALVYILRPSTFGMVVRMFVRCDSVHIGSTMAHNFVYAMLDPGTHTLRSTSENNSTLEITVDAGKVYYVKQEVKMGFAIAETGLKLVDEKEGQKYLQKCKLAKDNVASSPPR